MERIFGDDYALSSTDKRRGLLLWYYLSRFFNHSVRLSNQHLKEWDLTAAQFDILVHIGLNQVLTQKQLGEKLLVTKGNITQLIGKMENMGLIQREREWREKRIKLTEAGKEIYQNVVPQQEKFQASQFDALSQDEQHLLLGLLKKLYKSTDA
ncbi:MAG TPA: MarR family transcriptional regulator [Pseudogracilibacillus sp.]|nr:MarR family transcriptional regulator [Pseudogracilibacillus sp.]